VGREMKNAERGIKSKSEVKRVKYNCNENTGESN
jgi:hypothetical protein